MGPERDTGTANIERMEGITHNRNDHRSGPLGRNPISRSIIVMARIELYVKYLFLFPEQTQLSGSWPCFQSYCLQPVVNSPRTRSLSCVWDRFPAR